MAFTLDYQKSTLAKGVGTLDDKLNVALLMYATTKASTIEGKMKSNRPWTDRTGEAKRQLTVKVSKPKPEIIRLTLAHGVNYGIWLEFAHEKNYAIIAPTVNQEGPNLITGLANLMNRMGGGK